MRDELLNGEIFYSLREAQIIIERWTNHYNTKRPHSALGYRPPVPETIVPMDQSPIMQELSNCTTQVGLFRLRFDDGGFSEGTMDCPARLNWFSHDALRILITMYAVRLY
jgi:hypothetical protein